MTDLLPVVFLSLAIVCLAISHARMARELARQARDLRDLAGATYGMAHYLADKDPVLAARDRAEEQTRRGQ